MNRADVEVLSAADVAMSFACTDDPIIVASTGVDDDGHSGSAAWTVAIRAAWTVAGSVETQHYATQLLQCSLRDAVEHSAHPRRRLHTIGSMRSARMFRCMYDSASRKLCFVRSSLYAYLFLGTM